MKRVFFKVMFVITITMGLLVTANAQPPIPVKVTPKPTKSTTKPMSEDEWMKKNNPQPTRSNNCSECGPWIPPQPVTVYVPQQSVDYQWVKKLVNGKKYTIKLRVYPNHDGQNTLTVFSEEQNEINRDVFDVASDISNISLEQTGDWKKLTFNYISNNYPVTIEIENLY